MADTFKQDFDLVQNDLGALEHAVEKCGCSVKDSCNGWLTKSLTAIRAVQWFVNVEVQ